MPIGPSTVATGYTEVATQIEQQRKTFKNPRGLGWYYALFRKTGGIGYYNFYKSLDGIGWYYTGIDLPGTGIGPHPDLWIVEDETNTRLLVYVVQTVALNVRLHCYEIDDSLTNLSSLFTINTVAEATDDYVRNPSITLDSSGYIWVTWTDEFTNKGKQRNKLRATRSTTPCPVTAPSWETIVDVYGEKTSVDYPDGITCNAGPYLRSELVPLIATANVGVVFSYYHLTGPEYKLKACTLNYDAGIQEGTMVTLDDTIHADLIHSSVAESGVDSDVFTAYKGASEGISSIKWDVSAASRSPYGADEWVEVAPKLGSENYIWDLVVFNGKLYGGTGAPSGPAGGKLYEWNGVDKWVQVAPKLGDEYYIWRLAVFNGKIYGGTWIHGKLYEWDGVDEWIEVAPQLGGEVVCSLAVFNNKLYGGVGGLYEWDGVDKWVEVAPELGGQSSIYSLAVFNNKLYGGTYPNGKLYEWDEVSSWVEVAPQLGNETRIHSLAVFNNKLYGGTTPNGKLYEWNGVDEWVEVAPQLGIETDIYSLTVFNGKLYGGTGDNSKLYRWDGVDKWIEAAPKLGNELDIYSLAVFNDKLYGGTAPNGKLYRWDPVVQENVDSLAVSLDKSVSPNKLYIFYVKNGVLGDVFYKTTEVDAEVWSAETKIDDDTEFLDYLSASYQDWNLDGDIQIIYTRQTSYTVRFWAVGVEAVEGGFKQWIFISEPPTGGQFNKISYDTEPQVPGAWNKVKREV